MKKILGIAGGMGPWATSYIFEKVIVLTQAQTDQDHIHIFVDNNTNVPDRTEAILGGGPSPIPEVNASIGRLEKCGAGVILIPCNTMHYFMDEVVRKPETKILDIIEITVDAGLKRGKDDCFGILATDGTIESGIFQNACRERGLQYVLPGREDQKTVMRMIYDVIKKGEDTENLRPLVGVMDRMQREGAEHFICGCTELSMLCGCKMFDRFDLVDSSTELARQAIVECGYTVKG